MARWRLTQPHYINVLIDGEPTQWEYKEIDRTTGKQGRKVYNVPCLLDPKEPADHNYPGEIIVAQGKVSPKDIIFLGEPTPDMEPIDEEAEKISAEFQKKWVHPIDSLSNEGGYAGKIFEDFSSQLSKLLANIPAQTPNVSVGGVSSDDFAKLQAQVAELMARNAELEAAPAKTEGRRRA